MIQNSYCYLVDPASGHMLVLKIKPCMPKFKLWNGETADGSIDQLLSVWWLESFPPTFGLVIFG